MEIDEKELAPKERMALGGSMLLAMVIVISTCCMCFSFARKNSVTADIVSQTNDVNILLDKALTDISNMLFRVDYPKTRPSDFR